MSGADRPRTAAERGFAERAAERAALDLERAPFSFPPPAALLVEGCKEGGAYADKSPGAWRVAELPALSRGRASTTEGPDRTDLTDQGDSHHGRVGAR